MRIDTHPAIGAKRRGTWDEALAHLRALWPRAYVEGSTGPSRSFWVGGEPRLLVGYCWKVRGGEDYWFRVAAGPDDAVTI